MKKKIIIASDFDGTLTTKDTMLEFIRHCYGTHGLIIHLLRIMPFLLLMKIKVYPNGKAKERLLRNCFSGKTQTQLSQLAQRFADDNTHLLRHSLLTRLRTAQSEGTEVFIVTASADLWVTKMVPDLTVISTQLEFDDNGIFTGRLLTPNCHGAEKVRRLENHYSLLRTERHQFHVIAYGDSAGDKQLLQYADEPHWV